jgi:lipopolysaccharide export system protein LptA
VPNLHRFIFAPDRVRWFRTIALFAIVVLLTNVARAADEPQTDRTENEPIQIVADELISYNDEKYAEFLGNVKVTQGDFTINADKLIIHYEGELLENKKKSSNEEVLKKIIAVGNVKIDSEQYHAEADKAEYDKAAKTVVLSGENARVVSGKNSITGSKITLNQNSGQVKVESSETKRIKAEFFTKDKTSDVFKFEKSEE